MKKISLLLTLAIVLSATVPSYAKRPKGCDYYYYKSPCWMPDSKHIVYIKNVSHHEYHYGWIANISKGGDICVGEDYYICKMNVEIGKEEVIKQFTAKYLRLRDKDKFYVFEGKKRKKLAKMVQPWWIDCSPDGKLLCFASGHGSGEEPGVYMMNIDGSGLKKVADNGGDPRFSPDSKQILFKHAIVNYIPGKGKSVRGKGLWLMDVDGSNKRFLAENAWCGIWHPSGKKIAYHREKENGSTYIMDLKTKETRVLTTKMCGPKDWSPDGKYINFISTSRDISGKRVKTGFKDVPEYGRFSPDGLKMVGGSLDITFSKVGDKKETVLLRNYSKEY